MPPTLAQIMDHLVAHEPRLRDVRGREVDRVRRAPEAPHETPIAPVVPPRARHDPPGDLREVALEARATRNIRIPSLIYSRNAI